MRGSREKRDGEGGRDGRKERGRDGKEGGADEASSGRARLPVLTKIVIMIPFSCVAMTKIEIVIQQ